MYSAGAKDYFDDLALHPYSGTNPPTGCSDPIYNFKCGIVSIRNVMRLNTDSHNIWITEIGWSSYIGSGGVGETDQAQYLQQTCEILKTYSYIPVVIWYNLVDRTFDTLGYNTQDRENWYGLFHNDLSSKPAASQFLQCTAQ